MTRGYKRADVALQSSSAFNGELEGAILCVIEEIDMGRDQQAYNRMKDWKSRLRDTLEPILAKDDPRPDISAYKDMPLCIFLYDPTSEFELIWVIFLSLPKVPHLPNIPPDQPPSETPVGSKNLI